MVRLQAADGGDGLQLWNVASNLLYKFVGLASGLKRLTLKYHKQLPKGLGLRTVDIDIRERMA